MPWWSWIVIWIALAALAALFLAYIGYRLFKLVTAVYREFSRASDAIAAGMATGEGALPEHPAPLHVSAAFRDPAAVRAENGLLRETRLTARRQRRIRRRATRGQPQMLGDLPHV